MNSTERSVVISAEVDVADAVFEAHVMSEGLGFGKTDRFMIATAVSELARNICLYAGSGAVILRTVSAKGKEGIEITAEDAGPGIQDITQALGEGYSTGGTLGLGLPGARRLMDEFVFDSERVVGVKIVVRKWL